MIQPDQPQEYTQEQAHHMYTLIVELAKLPNPFPPGTYGGGTPGAARWFRVWNGAHQVLKDIGRPLTNEPERES